MQHKEASDESLEHIKLRPAVFNGQQDRQTRINAYHYRRHHYSLSASPHISFAHQHTHKHEMRHHSMTEIFFVQHKYPLP